MDQGHVSQSEVMARR